MTALTRFFALFLALSALAGCAGHGNKTYAIPDGPRDYVLGVGDNLRITVFGQENLSGEFSIEQSGAISYPLIKDVPAAGKTARELEQDIANRLSPGYIVDPRVSVEVIAYRNIFVLGEVRTPGQYEFAPNMTILQAIAIAGGYTYRADEDEAEVTRHVRGALKTFTVDNRTMLKPGDTVVIGRRWF